MGHNHKFDSLKSFYAFYLTEHKNPISRTLHFIGTGLVIVWLFACIYTHNLIWLWALPFIGYSFAWAGHFFFEKNKPATFQYPFYSLASDFILFWELLRGKEKFRS